MQCRFELAAGLMKSTASASYICISLYIKYRALQGRMPKKYAVVLKNIITKNHLTELTDQSIQLKTTIDG